MFSLTLLFEKIRDVNFTMMMMVISTPLSSDALHGAPHERIALQDGVEVVDMQGEHVAVRLCAHARNAARVREQADLAKVGTIAQRCSNLRNSRFVGHGIGYR